MGEERNHYQKKTYYERSRYRGIRDIMIWLINKLNLFNYILYNLVKIKYLRHVYCDNKFFEFKETATHYVWYERTYDLDGYENSQESQITKIVYIEKDSLSENLCTIINEIK